MNTKSSYVNLWCVNSTKDLGIIVDNNLSFVEHINEKVKKANIMLGLIKRNFINMNENTFILLYKSPTRSQLKYGASVWYPHKKESINIIEGIQRRATKLIPKIKYICYEDRLKFLKLSTLCYRGLRSDMIETYTKF